MPMIETEDNYYDFYGLEERVSDIQTQVSEVHEDVKIVETQISELVSVQSEQFSELMSVQSEQASEIVSVMNDNVAANAAISKRSEVEIILLFAVIAVVGIVCGFVASLTWRSNKNG